MIQRYNLLRMVLALFTVLVLGQQTAQAQSATQIVNRVRDKYKSVQTLRADFTQTMSSPYGSDTQTLSGTVYLQGSKYRVESARHTYVTNGQVVWVYNADEKQVLVNDNTNDAENFSPNEFLFNFDKHYNAVSVKRASTGGQKYYALVLKPKRTDSAYKDVTLWVNAKDMLVSRIDVLDVNDTRIRFALRNQQLNQRLDANLFTFQAPQGVEVVDLRS